MFARFFSQVLPLPLSPSLLKLLLGRPLGGGDIEAEDPQLAASLKWLLDTAAESEAARQRRRREKKIEKKRSLDEGSDDQSNNNADDNEGGAKNSNKNDDADDGADGRDNHDDDGDDLFASLDLDWSVSTAWGKRVDLRTAATATATATTAQQSSGGGGGGGFGGRRGQASEGDLSWLGHGHGLDGGLNDGGLPRGIMDEATAAAVAAAVAEEGGIGGIGGGGGGGTGDGDALVPVLARDAEAYVAARVRWALLGSVGPMAWAMARGFYSMM